MKKFNRIICWIVGIWRSMKCHANVCGCDFVDEIHGKLALIDVARCAVCGEYSITWTPVKPEAEDGK